MMRIAVVACALLMGSLPAQSQECAGPLRLIVGLSAGGGIDALARLLGQRLTTKFGRTVVVENMAGAGGNIAASYVAKAAPDGCTLLATGNNHTVNPMIYPKAGYGLKDFTPVIRAVDGTSVLVVHAQQPFRTVDELVQYARANPDKLSYSSSGIGLPNHVAMELFLKAAKIDVVHVPYKGSAPALNDTVAGVVPVSITSSAAALPFIKSGKIRALVISAHKRWPTLPDTPTVTEAGYPDASNVTWIGILAPAGTPAAARIKLNQEFRSVLEETEIRDRLRLQSYETVGGSIEDFDSFLHKDEQATRKLMSELKLKVE